MSNIHYQEPLGFTEEDFQKLEALKNKDFVRKYQDWPVRQVDTLTSPNAKSKMSKQALDTRETDSPNQGKSLQSTPKPTSKMSYQALDTTETDSPKQDKSVDDVIVRLLKEMKIVRSDQKPIEASDFGKIVTKLNSAQCGRFAEQLSSFANTGKLSATERLGTLNMVDGIMRQQHLLVKDQIGIAKNLVEILKKNDPKTAESIYTKARDCLKTLINNRRIIQIVQNRYTDDCTLEQLSKGTGFPEDLLESMNKHVHVY